MFLTIWDSFEPFWTLLGHFRQKSICCPMRTKLGSAEVLLSEYHFSFEVVQKGPDGPMRVPNGQKHLGLPFRTVLDPFGPLWNNDKPAMFSHFCLFCWCIFFGTPCIYTSSHPVLFAMNESC